MRRGHRAVATLIAALAICGTEFLTSAPAEAQSGPCGDSVVIGFGDTLASIASRCGVTVNAIMEANPLLPSQHFVFPGLRIRMPAPPPPPPPSDVIRYVVRPGDTLYRIARANNVTIADILRLNPNVNSGSSLRVGDAILLPGSGLPPPPADTVRYVVKRGDTISGIARANNVSVSEILRLNPNVSTVGLRVGDVLLLPARAAPPPPPPPPTNTVRYTVRPGDTLFSIARANGMTISELRDLNPGLTGTLRVGDVILVRSGIVPPPPPPAGVEATVSPSSGAPGSIVQVSASGFRASATLRLLAGSDASSLQEFQQVTTDASGRANVSVRVPAWAATRGTLVFAFETLDGRLRALSGTFRVTTAPQPPAPTITVRGTLTREGVSCQAMRGDDGALYTLAGDVPRSMRPGDRVRVVGRVAEVSICQQGTTISVERITELN